MRRSLLSSVVASNAPSSLVRIYFSLDLLGRAKAHTLLVSEISSVSAILRLATCFEMQ